jgi:hypothetical protein
MDTPEESISANPEYLACLCKELATLARNAGFETGAYLLQMAHAEFTQLQIQGINSGGTTSPKPSCFVIKGSG